MNKSLRWAVLLLLPLLVACKPGVAGILAPAAGNTAPPGTVQVEILYMDHPPLQPTLQAVDKLLAGYGDQVSVTRYEAFSDEGIAFAKAKKLTGHVPLAILINGSDNFSANGQTVRFYSFPKGSGAGMVPDGDWSLDDLKQALDQAVGK